MKKECKGKIIDKNLDLLKKELNLNESELKKKEKNLKQKNIETDKSKKKVLNVYDLIPASFFFINKKGVITEINSAGIALLKVGRKKIINSQFPCYGENDKKEFSRHLKKVFKTGKRQTCGLKLIRKDGTIFFAQLKSISSKDTEQKVTICRTVLIEVLDRRKKAERALKKSSEELRILSYMLDQSPSVVVLTDPTGNIQYVNKKFTELTGYSPEEAIGENPRILKSGQTPDVEYKMLWKTISSGEEWRGEFCNKKKNGDPYWEEAIISPVKNQKGKITHFAALMKDITDLKHAGEKHKNLEEQLRHSQKMEAVGTLVDGISHDFNNILHSVIGFANLLKKRLQLKSKDKRFVENIIVAAERGSDLTKHLLTFSRKHERKKEPLDLRLLIEETLKLLRPTIPSTIKIETNFDNTPCIISGNSSQIHQVIMNIFVNAAQAMLKGGVLNISLRLFEQDIYGHYEFDKGDILFPAVELIINDSGTGIDKSIRHRIFDPFFTTKTVGEGTGLGLSIVHGIVKNHGGKIAFFSELGRGTSFFICFPLIDDIVGVNNQELNKSLSLSKARILFVDDEDLIVDMIKESFINLGLNIVAFTESNKAFSIFLEKPDQFDVIITDQTMPDMTGLEFAKKIKRIRRDIPILLCTGYGHKISLKACKDIGIKKLLKKPIALDDLVSAINDVLENRGKYE